MLHRERTLAARPTPPRRARTGEDPPPSMKLWLGNRWIESHWSKKLRYHINGTRTISVLLEPVEEFMERGSST